MPDGVFLLLFNAGQRLVAHAGISGGVCRLAQRRPGTSRDRSGATAADSILRGDEQRQSGVRLGEADLVLRRLNIIMKKMRQKLEVPLNDGATQILEARQGAKHGPFVFYNPTTGNRFHDVKLALKSAVKRAGLSGITWHTFRHVHLAAHTQRGVNVKELLGHSTVPVTHAFERQSEASGVG
jgi:hypothetical protein